MKRKINTINGKRLVIGNTNEISKDEILVQQTKEGTISLKERVGGQLKELSGGSTSGGGNNGNNSSASNGLSLKFYKVKSEYTENKELGNWVFNKCAYWSVSYDNYTTMSCFGPDKNTKFYEKEGSTILKAFAISFEVLDYGMDNGSNLNYFNKSIIDKVEEISFEEFKVTLESPY